MAMTDPEKIDALSSANRLLHPMHTVLVTCADETGKPDIITLAWAMPTSINPPMVAVSISPRRLSHALIKETKEFVVNIPTMDIVKETLYCGRVSGRRVDKFKETGLTPLPAKKVKPPAIKECVAHLECRLQRQIKTGDHTIFVGEVIEAYANKDAFTTEYKLGKARMIFHVGGNKFTTLKARVSRPKLTHMRR